MSEPFYTEAQPCESCGRPTYQPRQWNAEHELWVAVDCSCNLPDEPIAPCMMAAMDAAQTVNELRDAVRSHLKSCPVCNPNVVELPKRAPRRQKQEAA